jgi:hypothetical protein
LERPPCMKVRGLSMASCTRRLKSWTCSEVPWASTRTLPSSMFLTQPVMCASEAQPSTVKRNPTAWTLPV